MNANYFWKNGAVEVIQKQLISDDFKQDSLIGYFYCPCVDTFTDETGGRYGRWHPSHGAWSIPSWESIPAEQLPKEFRMHLLLMGVA